MFLNPRRKSKALIYYEALARRSILTNKDQRKFAALSSGFEGEVEYDALFDAAGHGGLLIYRDLWLKAGQAVLQVDSLIIADGLIGLNEVKNFSGDHRYADGEWTIGGLPAYEDPLAQVSRTAGKLQKISRHLPHPADIEKKVVFVNPGLNLEFHSDDHARFIVERSRLPNYFKAFGRRRAGGAAQANARAIAAFIIDDPMALPVTDPGRVRMGNACYGCGAFRLEVGKYKAVCEDCGYAETTERMFVRALIDFSVLFHDRKVTSAGVSAFIGHVLRPRTVRRFLNKYCHRIGNNKSAAYTVKTTDLKMLLMENGYSSHYEKDESFKPIKN